MNLIRDPFPRKNQFFSALFAALHGTGAN